MKAIWSLTAATTLAAAIALSGSAVANSSPTAESTSPAAEPRKAVTTFSGNGTFRVGQDIKPGTYVSTSTGSFGGYWERLSCATGEFDCIIANDNVTGQTFVTIEKSDRYFSTSRMGTWRLASKVKPKKAARAFAGDGMYRVGIDIRPGTYVSSPSSSLGGYWERLSCATGEFDCLIANDLVDGRTFVKISKDDKYFSTSRMGKWKRAR